MAKPDEKPEREPNTPWGTWEELLLACAVNRYGTKNWDSVAVEIRKRSPAPTLHHLLTPLTCKQKFHDLKLRYTPKPGPRDEPVAELGDVDAATDDKTNTETVPWLDELRKIRVDELKREVERYDLSIVSLQLKVKRLKEEREQSLTESENGGEKSDLRENEEREREEENREGKNELEKLSPESFAGKPACEEESDRDNQSVNESNSTDPKCEHLETGAGEAEKEPVSDRTGEEKPEPVKPVREDSCNGSSDSIDKEPVRETVKVEPEGGASESHELWESVAESKGGSGEEVAKESSDVQSSASKLRKEENDMVRCGSSSGDGRVNEDQSPAMKGIPVKSETVADFLEIIRSHKLGSVFERRLESQESSKYRNLIRQHMDLETVQTSLEEGLYSDYNHKLFRDLLLLVNNVIVFFGKKSSKSVAAIEVRQLISKEMAQRITKSELSAEPQTSLPLVSLPLKQAPESSDSLLLKPKVAGSMIVCRKRSSIAAKASALSSGSDRKQEQPAPLAEEKPVLDLKQPDKSSVIAEEHQITKKRTRDRFASSSKSSKKNGSKTLTNTDPNKNSEALSIQNQGNGGSPNEDSESKSEKKNSPTTVDVKKRGAANFLNRMKRSSSSNNGPVLDKLTSSFLGPEKDGKGASEQKRSGNRKVDGRKDQVSKRGSGGRQLKEQESPAKKTVGRPPKRAAAPSPSLAVSGKRIREVVETRAVTSKQPKKRSRK